ncbi:hypothetical protein [Longimicrobium sp.]|jgi:hypothetical protein|uniref:Tc toxin subunit A-related protein n=1 Tax=Longimicrobium sp. TaxID=2029185 RepID=UPI002F927D5D
MPDSFHILYDLSGGGKPGGDGSLAKLAARKLGYRFTTHFHPYAGRLVERLIERSVRGLQATDTEYSTPAVLATAASATRADDTGVTLEAGEEVRLGDGARLTLADGTAVRLAGGRLTRRDTGAAVTQPPPVAATLPQGARVSRADGTRATLAAATAVRLPAAAPRLAFYEPLFTPSRYDPDPAQVDERHWPAKELDFSTGGGYAVYNWELFFHVPFTIAVHLSKNGRFDEAQRWFHYIFDPTDDSDGPTPERFWKVKPFQRADVRQIEEVLANLSAGTDPALREETLRSIQAWRNAPFRPHVVARHRPWAYMYKTVMAYLDNLVAWGDALFREDTGESINEATQLYVLAANLLGPRPQAVPRKGTVGAQSYAQLRDDLDAFGNALRELETDIPFDAAPLPHAGGGGDAGRLRTLRGLSTLYFCVPRNDRLVGYWDTVADRLFKIRNSLNFQGAFRQLPLFEPPIDPALLARAVAAGVDVGAAVRGADQPLPLVRFGFLLQKAAEICHEVKALGSALLAAVEKEDNEALAALRARHERVVMGLAETVRYGQLQEARKAREGVELSMANAVRRYVYYERLLGRPEGEIRIPELEALDTGGLREMRFNAAEPAVAPRPIDVDIAASGGSTLNQATRGLLGEDDVTGGRLMSRYEAQELDLLEQARLGHVAAVHLDVLSAGLGLIPQFDAYGSPLGVGAGVGFGGVQLSRMTGMMASVARGVSDGVTYAAGRAAKMGSYARREQEWALQSNLAAGEITQAYKQLRAAQIREAVAEREWINHQQQVRNAREIEAFLAGESGGKTTTRAFYAWMRRETRGLYGQSLQLAVEVARKAERALRQELGDPDLAYIQPGYLAGREGLLAGERLQLDIKRMELAYHELNRREYELTRHVSLLQVAPAELLRLRATGRCTLSIPESLFDMDGPGHYFRRIRSVAVSVPCVTGPYTSVNCTLTLVRSSIRRSPALGGGYARRDAQDERFSDHFGGIQAIVTSAGQSDSGMFDPGARDERYLPFEWSGAISEWRLELPANPARGEPCQFDYGTIADVVLHLRYTARDGGAALRDHALAELSARIDEAEAAGSVRLFSVRHEFPTEWARFRSAAPAAPVALVLPLRAEHYPFWSQGRLGAVRRVDLFAKTTRTVAVYGGPDPAAAGVRRDSIGPAAMGELRTGTLENIPLPPSPTGDFTLYFDDNSMDDLWLALAWGA